MRRVRTLCSPCRATIFHAVGLKVMDAKERYRDVLDTSRRALRDIVGGKTGRVVGQSHDSETWLSPDENLRTILDTQPATLL
jgi:hypothetical protein